MPSRGGVRASARLALRSTGEGDPTGSPFSYPSRKSDLNQYTTIEEANNPATAPWGSLAISDELRLSSLAETQFASLVLERGIAHTAEASWATSVDSLDAVLPHALTTTRAHRGQSALLDVSPLFGELSLALVTLIRGSACVRTAAAELHALGEIESWLRACFPLAVSEHRQVPVSFWSYGSYGATSTSRRIDVPAWEDISRNYPDAVRSRLDRLVDPSFRPAEGGQLVLWHGPPGTGKTYALRALAWEWRRWCELHYVVDPEVLFGKYADYLLEVVLDEDDEGEKWRLLVLEDTGELLAADAKAQTGQGLSRLLNLVDGIVGQGLRVLVLVTTNEPLKSLHPAVARPGRCAAKVEFAPFPAGEAAAWLEARGAEPEDAMSGTLATLFARLAGAEPEQEQPFGFAQS